MSISRPTLSLLCSALALALAIPVAAADLPTGSPKSQGLSAERLGRIHGVLQNEIDTNRMPGAVVLVARKGDWQVNGAALPAGDSAVLDAPGSVELTVGGDEAELYAVWLMAS